MAEAQDSTKRCSRCSEEKPLDAFPRGASARNGRPAKCKACRNVAIKEWQQSPAGREWRKAYVEAHRDEIKKKNRPANRDRMRRIRAANPELAREKARDYFRRARARNEAAYLNANAIRQRRRRERDADRVRAEDRAHYRRRAEERKARQRAQIHKDPETYALNQTRWRKARIARNPELHRTKSSAYGEARRARELAAPGRGVTKDQWLEIVALVGRRCEYCNRQTPPTMDHIDPLARGGEHDVDNIAVTCRKCNASKRDNSLLVWLAKRKQRQAMRKVA